MRISLLLFIVLLVASCESEPILRRGNTAIIPKPMKMELKQGVFEWNNETDIYIAEEDAEWMLPANYLLDQLEFSANHEPNIKPLTGKVKNGLIFLKSNNLKHPEEYELKVEGDRIEIISATPQGAFYGVISLLQIMPTEIFGKETMDNLKLAIPQMVVVDKPRFSYRGMHLDVCRHFYGVEAVKRYIDLLAIHKFNRFHWHLTEDQGWRIEIKQYPKLTTIGAFRPETLIGHYNDEPQKFDGKRYGGFYTQAQIKEVVAYAAKRFITVIPEIELPGHAQAAIAAYPELGCLQDTVLQVMTKWGVSENVFCPTEETFQFLENVLTEVIALFPGDYIHIGGDECPKTQWKESDFVQDLMVEKQFRTEEEVQSYFIKRIETFLNEKGKKLIGWDEILEGGLAPNATVMSWRGTEGGIDAAKAGHDVVMTPTSHCYFDYYQSQHENEPLAIGGFLPLEKVYNYEPIPKELNKRQRKHILGAQGNVWTEYISTQSKLDYMTYPRASAMAEVNWTQKKQRDFSDFARRLETHFERLNLYGVGYSTNIYDVDGNYEVKDGKVILNLTSNVPNATIQYSLNGSKDTADLTTFVEPIVIDASAKVYAQQFYDGEPRGRDFTSNLNWHKAAGKSVKLKYKPAPRYAAGGINCITNGINGSNDRYGDKEWLGFAGKDFNAIIDMDSMQKVTAVDLRFFKGEGQWIYLPKKVNVYSSKDGRKFDLVAASTQIMAEGKIATPTLELNTETRYLKIVAERFGEIPDGAQGAGNEAWLFVDEVVVR